MGSKCSCLNQFQEQKTVDLSNIPDINELRQSEKLVEGKEATAKFPSKNIPVQGIEGDKITPRDQIVQNEDNFLNLDEDSLLNKENNGFKQLKKPKIHKEFNNIQNNENNSTPTPQVKKEEKESTNKKEKQPIQPIQPIHYDEDTVKKIQSVLNGVYFRQFLFNNTKKELEDLSDKLYEGFIEISKNEKVENAIQTKQNPPEEFKEYFDEMAEYNEDPQYNTGNKNEYIRIIYEENLSNSYNGRRVDSYNKYQTSEKIAKILENASKLYKGNFDYKRDVMDGYGVLIYRDGTYLDGLFSEGKFKSGKYIDSQGMMYIGKFEDGKNGKVLINDKGIKYNSIKNSLYYGNFVKGLKEGEGIFINEIKKYEGEFKDDRENGKAKISYKCGDIYEGGIKNGKFEGEGYYYWKKNGHSYKGSYKDGKFEGEGFYKFNEMEFYKGHYVNGIKQGQGEITYENGTKVCCNFDNGKLNGIGTLLKGKKPIEVEFINGKLNRAYNNKGRGKR